MATNPGRAKQRSAPAVIPICQDGDARGMTESPSLGRERAAPAGCLRWAQRRSRLTDVEREVALPNQLVSRYQVARRHVGRQRGHGPTGDVRRDGACLQRPGLTIVKELPSDRVPDGEDSGFSRDHCPTDAHGVRAQWDPAVGTKAAGTAPDAHVVANIAAASQAYRDRTTRLALMHGRIWTAMKPTGSCSFHR